MSGREALIAALEATRGMMFEAAIHQACDQLKAAGYAIVPLEPTEVQIKAADDWAEGVVCTGSAAGFYRAMVVAVYRAMVAAAEEQP